MPAAPVPWPQAGPGGAAATCSPDIKYTATYFDASVHNPERLTLDVLQDGEKAGSPGRQPGHARASNYLSLVSMTDAATAPAGAAPSELRDELTGEDFDFTADVIVNTTGAWVDLTNEAMGAASSFMGGTKGSHIVLDHPELLAACNGGEIFFEHTDGRIVLIYPMGDRVLVGTTDVDADMAEDAVCTDERDRLLLRPDRPRLPGHPGRPRPDCLHLLRGPSAAEARCHAARLRLPRLPHRTPDRGADGAAAGAVVLSLVGGKWTTFRALCRTPDQRCAGRTRDGAQDLDGEARHRRRRRLPGHRRRQSSGGSRPTCAAGRDADRDRRCC